MKKDNNRMDVYSNKKIKFISPDRYLKDEDFCNWYFSTIPKITRRKEINLKINR